MRARWDRRSAPATRPSGSSPGSRRPHWLPRRPHWLPRRPHWLRWRRRYLLVAPILVAALSLGWYAHWGWRAFYVNRTPGTTGGDAAVAVVTDHTTYLGDEPLAITVTNHLAAPIYTQVTPDGSSLGTPCSIDLYTERLDDGGGRWLGDGSLGVGAGCDVGCSGTAPRVPPPRVQAIAPGASYTQRWQPSAYAPTNPPGTYRLVFRYSTDPAAAMLTRVGCA